MADYNKEDLANVKKYLSVYNIYLDLDSNNQNYDELKNNYKKLSKLLHPDKNHAPRAVEAFQQLSCIFSRIAAKRFPDRNIDISLDNVDNIDSFENYFNYNDGDGGGSGGGDGSRAGDGDEDEPLIDNNIRIFIKPAHASVFLWLFILIMVSCLLVLSIAPSESYTFHKSLIYTKRHYSNQYQVPFYVPYHTDVKQIETIEKIVNKDITKRLKSKCRTEIMITKNVYTDEIAKHILSTCEHLARLALKKATEL